MGNMEVIVEPGRQDIVIKRDFDEKAPTETDMVARLEARVVAFLEQDAAEVGADEAIRAGDQDFFRFLQHGYVRPLKAGGSYDLLAALLSSAS